MHVLKGGSPLDKKWVRCDQYEPQDGEVVLVRFTSPIECTHPLSSGNCDTSNYLAVFQWKNGEWWDNDAPLSEWTQQYNPEFEITHWYRHIWTKESLIPKQYYLIVDKHDINLCDEYDVAIVWDKDGYCMVDWGTESGRIGKNDRYAHITEEVMWFRSSSIHEDPVKLIEGEQLVKDLAMGSTLDSKWIRCEDYSPVTGEVVMVRFESPKGQLHKNCSSSRQTCGYLAIFQWDGKDWCDDDGPITEWADLWDFKITHWYRHVWVTGKTVAGTRYFTNPVGNTYIEGYDVLYCDPQRWIWEDWGTEPGGIEDEDKLAVISKEAWQFDASTIHVEPVEGV